MSLFVFLPTLNHCAVLPLPIYHFGPIRDTIKSTVAAIGIEQMKNA